MEKVISLDSLDEEGNFFDTFDEEEQEHANGTVGDHVETIAATKGALGHLPESTDVTGEDEESFGEQMASPEAYMHKSDTNMSMSGTEDDCKVLGEALENLFSSPSQSSNKDDSVRELEQSDVEGSSSEQHESGFNGHQNEAETQSIGEKDIAQIFKIKLDESQTPRVSFHLPDSKNPNLAEGSSEEEAEPANTILSPTAVVGSMFGAFSSWGRSAKDRVSKFVETIDLKIVDSVASEADAAIVKPSAITEPESVLEDEKSFTRLFSSISPKTLSIPDPSPSNNGETDEGRSWISGLDRSFDFASEKLGNVLSSGIRTIGSTMGVAIEPITSPIGVATNAMDEGYEVESSHGSSSTPEVLPLTDPIEMDLQLTPTTGAITKNIYSTLERLGKTTVNVVRSTRDRLVPLLDADALLKAKITEEDLKRRGWKDFFFEYSGEDALEKLQIKVSQAALSVKTKLKALPPKQLADRQARLKPIGKALDGLSSDYDQEELQQEKITMFLERLFANVADVDFNNRLIACLQEDNFDWEATIAEVEAQLVTRTIVDKYLLYLYYARCLLAKRLSAIHFLLLSITDYSNEELLVSFARFCLASTTKVQQLVISVDSLEDRKKMVLEKLIVNDTNQATAILADSFQSLNSLIKLAHL